MSQDITNQTRGNIFVSFAYKHRAVIANIITALLILLYTYASVSKLVDINKFTGQMNNQPMPNWMTPYLVWGIPGIELVVVGAILFDKTRRIGMWASLFLMSIFTIYVFLVVIKVFDRVPCSCGGVIEKMGWTEHLYFNLFFVFLSLIGIYVTNTRSR